MKKQQNTKSLLVRMSPELHKKMKLISVQTDCSLNDYVIKYFEQVVEKKEKENKNE